MKELQKQRLEGSGGKLLKPKTRLVKGTKFVSVLFIAASILISAGIMKAANVYYDLDTSTIMTTEKQSMSGDLTVTSGNISFSTTGTINQSGTGQVTFSGNVDATNGLDVTTANFTVGGSNFTVAPATGNVTTIGSIGIRESTGAAFYTYLQGGDQAANITYTLPVDAGGANYVLTSDGSGVLSWSATAAAVSHNLLSATHGDTLTGDGASRGSIIVGNSTPAWSELVIGAVGTVLQRSGDDLAWANNLTLAGAQTADITTAAGAAPTALVFQPGANSTASGTGASLTVKGGNETGTASTGGNVVIQGGTGTSTNGVVQIGTANTSAVTLGANGITTTNTGYLTSTQLLTASNGLTLTTGALNMTATSGALALSGLSASSINTGANNITFTSGNFNTTATGINSTAIGATTASTGAFTTLGSTGSTTLATGASTTNTFGSGASSVNTIGSITTPGALTLHGATTLDNTLTVSGAYLTTLGGNLVFAGATPTISASTANTSISLDANGTGAVNIAGTSTGDINFAGGSGSTGCTITTAGVLTCSGNISGGGAGTRASGEEVLVGIVPIFGYDYPAQTAATTFKTISRTMESNPFPAATTGTTREYKFIIRYADSLTVTEGPSLWNFYDVGTPASSIAFTVPYSPGISLEEGTVAIVDTTAGMKTLVEANGDWYLQVRPDDTATGKSIRVFSIDLAAYDQVN